mgnify:FL=1
MTVSVSAAGMQRGLGLLQALLGSPPSSVAVQTVLESGMLPVVQIFLKHTTRSVVLAAAACIGCMASLPDYDWIVTAGDVAPLSELPAYVRDALTTCVPCGACGAVTMSCALTLNGCNVSAVLSPRERRPRSCVSRC